MERCPLSSSKRASSASARSSISLITRLWRDYLSAYWPKLLLAIVAMAVFAASASAIPAGVEWINSAFTGGKPLDDRFAPDHVVFWGPLLIIVLGGINALAQYCQARLSASAALATLRDLQAAMFNRLTAIDEAQLRALGSGPAVARLTNDSLVLRETLTRSASAIRDLLTLVGLCGVMVWYDWVLFAVVIVVYAAIGWPIARIGKYLRRQSAEAQMQSGDIASLVNETTSGGRMIRAYNLEQRQNALAKKAVDRRLAILEKMARLRALNEPFIFFVGSIALAIVVGVVATRISAGALNVPQFISFIIALLLLSQPARGLSTLNAVVQEGLGAFERMVDLIDRQPEISDPSGAPQLQISSGKVAIEDVSFAYGDNAALNGLSLDALPGAVTAIVGPSGAGKSTLFNLLLRLYEHEGGTIRIDGQAIDRVTRQSLRDGVAIVSQETIIFDDTIMANIALGKKGATRDEIIAAARAAAAHEFIDAMPDGYDMRAGEHGANLSGGQRQRIAIARAFLKDAPILLLDEATSALDAGAEQKVQEALARLSEGRTTLTIAHRLATVKNADIIYVMDQGRVVECGTHRQLLQTDGAYARSVSLQLI